jgi:hypothetical protein
MATDYAAKQTATEQRIAQLEADQKTAKPAKAGRYTAKIAAAKETLARIIQKASGEKAAKPAKATKRGRTRAKK